MNKANIRLMGMLYPKIKLQIRNLFDVYQWVLIISLIFFVSCLSLAQEVTVQNVPPVAKASSVDNKTEITPLKIGDKIPDELWDMYFPVVSTASDKEQYLSLGDFKDKLIILDFWSTWCGNCIKQMPQIEDLQAKFKHEVSLIMVTPQGGKQIKEFLKKRNIGLTSVVSDTHLSKSFPADYIPHVVWIKNGKVHAITEGEFLTEKYINDVLKNKDVLLPVKVFNQQYDYKEPLLLEKNGGTKADLKYHSMVTGYLEGINYQASYHDTKNGTFKKVSTNLTPIQHFIKVSNEINPYLSHKNRVIIDVDEHASLITARSVFPELRKDFYCYELIVPEQLKRDVPQIMLNDLNNFFYSIYRLKAKVEKVKTMCWVLKKEGDAVNLLSEESSKGYRVIEKESSIRYENFPFSLVFIAMASHYQNQEYPLIDETGITQEVDFEFHLGMPDTEQFNAHLKQYGLYFKKEEREIDLFLIQEISDNNTL